MRYSTEQVATLRNTPITSYLYSLGIEPVSMSGGRLVYCCPLTGERTPSFAVHPQTNRFKCFGCDQKGDVIELVTRLEKLNFLPALKRLASVNPESIPSFSFICQPVSNMDSQPDSKTGLLLLDEQPLTSRVLREYVSDRGICFDVAQHYLGWSCLAGQLSKQVLI